MKSPVGERVLINLLNRRVVVKTGFKNNTLLLKVILSFSTQVIKSLIRLRKCTQSTF